MNKKGFKTSTYRIQSKNHTLETYEVKKTSLSCFDDKIYILENRIGV